MYSIKELDAAIDSGLKLTELGQKLYDIIKNVKGPSIEYRAMLYILVAQKAIHALGKERQGILLDAARCDVRAYAQVEALLERMHIYLMEDNIRAPLKKSISGIKSCSKDVEEASKGVRWRKKDKEKAVQDFLITIAELDTEIQNLEYDFFPEYSGQGLRTLIPIYELVKSMIQDHRRNQTPDAEVKEEKLADLIHSALCDPAHTEWMDKTAHLESTLVKLQLAFSTNIMTSSEPI